MPTLHHWLARRSGAFITITHSTGRVPGIERIEIIDGRVTAFANDGKQYVLAI